MGQSRQRTEAFLAGKYCVFCGGTVPATTIEHAPPRVMFVQKLRPKGHEFPACNRCNNGTSQQDQVAALMLFSTAETFFPGKFRRDFEKAALGVANNAAAAINYINTDAENEIWTNTDAPDQEILAIPVNKRLFSQWLNPWAAKQACAMWYQQTGLILSEEQQILVSWKTNPLDVGDDFLAFITENLTNGFHLSQGKKSFEDQFFYNFAIDDSKGYGAFWMVIHSVVGVLCLIADAKYFNNDTRIEYGELFRTESNNGLSRTL